MALYPCEIGGHRYPGPQRSAYITRMRDSTGLTKKLRLCGPHFGNLEEYLSTRLSAVGETSQGSMYCSVCLAERTVILFVTLYDQGAPERMYAGDFCDGCAERTLNAPQVAPERPLSAR